MQTKLLTCRFLTIAGLLLSPPSSRTAWAVTWVETVDGGAMNESFESGRVTPDGGFVIVGYTRGPAEGDSEGWILKLDSSGTAQWQRTLGGNDGEYLNDVCPSSQGGYVVVGETSSFGGASSDGLVLLLDAEGRVAKALTCASPGFDWFESVDSTPDGGFIAAGQTKTDGSNGYDGLLVRFDAQGEVLWARTFGTPYDDEFRCVRTRPDGGYLVAGATGTDKAGGCDIWVLRCKASGGVIYQHAFGGVGWDWALSVAHTADGGCIVSGTNGSTGPDSWNATILKLNAKGNRVWGEVLAGAPETCLEGIVQCEDGSYLAAGSLRFDDRDVGLALRLDSLGAISWQMALGSSLGSCRPLEDGGGFFEGRIVESSGVGDDGLIARLNSSGGMDAGACPRLTDADATVYPVSLVQRTTKATLASSTVSWAPRNIPGVSTNAVITAVCPTGVPRINGISSKTHKPGSPATIRGKGFAKDPKKNTVWFGSKKAPIEKADATEIKVTIPAVPRGTLSVLVVADGISSNSVPFVVK